MCHTARTTHHGGRGEDGFTLVEMLVVVVILGILIGYGIPTFLRAKNSSSDAAAKTRTRQALLTQKTFYTDRGLWGQAAEIQPLEPSVEFVDLDPDGPQVLGKVYVRVDGDAATLVSRSATGTCYWVRSSTIATTFAKAPCEADPTAAEFGPAW